MYLEFMYWIFTVPSGHYQFKSYVYVSPMAKAFFFFCFLKLPIAKALYWLNLCFLKVVESGYTKLKIKINFSNFIVSFLFF